MLKVPCTSTKKSICMDNYLEHNLSWCSISPCDRTGYNDKIVVHGLSPPPYKLSSIFVQVHQRDLSHSLLNISCRLVNFEDGKRSGNHMLSIWNPENEFFAVMHSSTKKNFKHLDSSSRAKYRIHVAKVDERWIKIIMPMARDDVL